MRRIRTTRQTRHLRERVMRSRRFDQEMLDIQIRIAKRQVKWLRTSDPRAGQLSPKQVQRISRLHQANDHNTLRMELAALAPGWVDLVTRQKQDGDDRSDNEGCDR